MFALVDKIGMETMDQVVKSGNALEASAMLRKALGI
jgi:hypothetical protein